ncbi:restriction endonuclease [Nakamurella lactea]|uniref:restriction endonuclease n=1 Tax=Nakamurella lactea TaxID=459515 RepID=UPI0006853FB9|nr:restriction endonuclease [Nakamurella lactea]
MLSSLFAADSSVLAGIDLANRTKREAASEVVSRLQRDEPRLQSLTLGVLMTLADWNPAFRNLARLEDGKEKVRAAQAALAEVKRVIGQHKTLVEDAAARKSADAAARAAAAQSWARTQDLETLKADFYRLSEMTDPQLRGLALEPFLNRLFALFDLDPRASFALKGEQIDGAFTFDTDDYLLEARWLSEKVDPKQVRDFAGKVAEKMHRTGGLMIGINGFSAEAVNLLRRNGSRVLLADGADLVAVLEGALGLDELLLRKRRHAAETGDPYLSAREMD